MHSELVKGLLEMVHRVFPLPPGTAGTHALLLNSDGKLQLQLVREPGPLVSKFSQIVFDKESITVETLIGIKAMIETLEKSHVGEA